MGRSKNMKFLFKLSRKPYCSLSFLDRLFCEALLSVFYLRVSLVLFWFDFLLLFQSWLSPLDNSSHAHPSCLSWSVSADLTAQVPVFLLYHKYLFVVYPDLCCQLLVPICVPSQFQFPALQFFFFCSLFLFVWCLAQVFSSFDLGSFFPFVARYWRSHWKTGGDDYLFKRGLV